MLEWNIIDTAYKNKMYINFRLILFSSVCICILKSGLSLKLNFF